MQRNDPPLDRFDVMMIRFCLGFLIAWHIIEALGS